MLLEREALLWPRYLPAVYCDTNSDRDKGHERERCVTSMLSLCWSPWWEHLTDEPNQVGIIPGSRCNLRTRTVTVNKLTGFQQHERLVVHLPNPESLSAGGMVQC